MITARLSPRGARGPIVRNRGRAGGSQSAAPIVAAMERSSKFGEAYDWTIVRSQIPFSYSSWVNVVQPYVRVDQSPPPPLNVNDHRGDARASRRKRTPTATARRGGPWLGRRRGRGVGGAAGA